MLKKLIFYGCLVILFACNNDNRNEEEIAQIPVDIKVERFDQQFAEARPEDLPSLKRHFPYLFPKQYPDSVWIEKMQDTIQLELNEAVAEQFPDFEETEEELADLFRHIKFYFPQTKIPKVVTLTSDVDYRNQVVWADSLLLISIDTYLGEEHPLYTGVQDYIKKQFRKEQIVPDVATSFGEKIIAKDNSRSFLSDMIYFGKLLYLKDVLIPFKTDSEKIGYTEEELDWAKSNEDQIWRYFVEGELLYSSDSDLATRFLYPAPFSKFYLELDNEAPARLGQFLGWQIVRQYMEKNEVSLQEMLEKNAEIIFKESKYKPKK